MTPQMLQKCNILTVKDIHRILDLFVLNFALQKNIQRLEATIKMLQCVALKMNTTNLPIASTFVLTQMEKICVGQGCNHDLCMFVYKPHLSL